MTLNIDHVVDPNVVYDLHDTMILIVVYNHYSVVDTMIRYHHHNHIVQVDKGHHRFLVMHNVYHQQDCHEKIHLNRTRKIKEKQKNKVNIQIHSHVISD